MLRWIVAALIIISSLSFSYYQLGGLPDINSDGTFAPSFQDAVRREVRANSSPDSVNKMISVAISRNDLAEASTLVEASTYVGFQVDENILNRLEMLEAQPVVFRNGQQAIMGCFGLTGIELQTTAELAGAIGCDFILIGDVRDILLHGGAYLRDIPGIRDIATFFKIEQANPDPVILTLALIGAGTSVASFSTVGAAASSDVAVSVVKNAKRADLLSPSFLRLLARQSSEAFDPADLGKDMLAVVNGTRKDILSLDPSLKNGIEAASVFKRRMENSALNGTLRKLSTINANVVENGTHIPAETMRLLKYVDEVEGLGNDLDGLVELSQQLGPKTRGVLKIVSSRQKTTAGKLAATLKKGVKVTDYIMDKIIAFLILISGTILTSIWLAVSRKFDKIK